MRITRETLLKIARDAAAERVRVSRRLICIYLTGSLLEDDPLLGGAADIDLVIIHDSEPLVSREIVKLTDEIHLDISHFAQEVFHHPRHLRADPWLGPFIHNKPLVLHDTQHWFEFTQASVGAQFYQPDNVMTRARPLAEAARQRWMQLQFSPSADHTQQVLDYLKTLEDSSNAIALLSGMPLTERRFLQGFPQRAQAIQRPDLSAALLSLMAGASVDESNWKNWADQWARALAEAGKIADAPARLHPARQAYYTRAAAALWQLNPTAALWLVQRTWTLAALHLPAEHSARNEWNVAFEQMGLGQAQFSDQLTALDQFLDNVEETLDQWSTANGLGNTVR